MPQYIGSSTPLGASATYTSPWVNSDQIFSQVAGSVYSDQAGTIYIEQSGDRINADVSASYAVVAATGEGYVETLILPYVRLRYVNGSSAQTTLRLFVRFILGNMP